MKSTTIVRAVLASAMLLAFGAHAQSNVYRWVDKNGKVHFSDTPPAEDARDVSQKKLGGGYVQESSLPYATQVAVKRNPVVLYTGPKCGTPCERGRDFLAGRGIPYSERDDTTKEGAEEMQKLGIRDVPVLMVGGRNLRGYDDDAWHAALDGAGYPRTALPGQADAVRQAAKPPTPPAPPAPPVPPVPGQPPAKAPAAEPSAGK
jgi:glutaredoxin